MILLQPYDASWPQAFVDEAERLRRTLGDLVVDLHHIGSTSVPGLSAKPVIDILAVVPTVEALDARSGAFEALGYEVMGEFGIPGRRYFRRDDSGGRRTHQVHAFAEGSSEIARHLDFRDYLRAHRSAADAYARLKLKLVAECDDDMRRYTDGKTYFIREIERLAAERRAGLGPLAP